MGLGRRCVESLPLCYKFCFTSSFGAEARETIKLCVAEGFLMDVSYLEHD